MEDTAYRKNLKEGLLVDIVQKKDQRSGELTRGYIDRILTNKAVHTQGIKVMLTNGCVGRVKHIITEINQEK
ncbi:MAG: YwbE family protein [Hespellia sp.]|nr:YwbE family protein [Hespellia sp.]